MKKDTRAKIIDAAIVLFDAQGIRGATVDAIAAKAGVTKKTLYYHFRSKDDLMVASLIDAPDNRQRLFDKILANPNLHIEDAVAALFWELSKSTADERWKGCAFSRAAAELVGLPGHPLVWAAKNYKDQIETAVRKRLLARGADDAALLARRIVILLDGAILHGMVHHDPAYPIEAGRMALGMIRDSIKHSEVCSDGVPISMDGARSFRESRDYGTHILASS
jgi:AcrR family transcriptional regulator